MKTGLSIGETVLVRHYSTDNSFKCIVKDIEKELVIIEPPISHNINISIFNLFENDPVAIISEKENEIFIYESIITEINFVKNYFYVNISNYQLLHKMRAYERFPTSIYIELIFSDTDKRDVAIIKNISENGACIISKMLYDIGFRIQFYLILESSLIIVNAVIVRKEKKSRYIEYGVSFVFDDMNAKELIKEYILQLEAKSSQK